MFIYANRIKNAKRSICIVLLLSFIALFLPVHTVNANENVFYVSAELGSDSNNGKSAIAPFKTISAAISAMPDGSVCYIMEGIYTESIAINERNNITFKAYENQDVAISPATVLENWVQEGNSNIWYTDNMTWDVYSGRYDKNIIFNENGMMHEARWPNVIDDADDPAHPLLDRETYARVISVGGNKLTIEGLDKTGLENAYLWIASGYAYWSYLVPITAQNGNVITANVGAVPSNICYISGSKALLDSEGEYYRDTENKKLYIYSNEEPQNIMARNSEYAIKVDNSTNIIFDGINVFGGVVAFGENDERTTGCEVKNATLETLDKSYPIYGGATGSWGNAKGLILGGNNNLVSACEIKNMYGPGVKLTGKGNRVLNNYIHDVNLQHMYYSDGVYMEGENHLISHNTIKYTGRGTIAGKMRNSVVSYNYLGDANRLSRDSGVIYLNAWNYENTEFHHNVLGESLNNEGMQLGLYLDSLSSGLIFYNNLIYGQEKPESSEHTATSIVHHNSLDNLFINNTFINEDLIEGSNYDRSGTAYVNNLFTKNWKKVNGASWTNMIDSNNVVVPTYRLNSDYTLGSSAIAAIDKGVYVNGITDEFVGKAPDVGAFEKNGVNWLEKVGHNFAESEYSNEKFEINTKIPMRNLLGNGGFNIKLNEAWTTTGTVYDNFQSTWNLGIVFTQNGDRGVKMLSNSSVSQRISGLKPNTEYEIGGFAAVAGPFRTPKAFDIIDNSSNINIENELVTGINSGNYIKYKKVDFGDGSFDKAMFGFGYSTVDGNTEAGELTIRLGSTSAEPILTIVTDGSHTNRGLWEWNSVDLNGVNGILEDVYFCFDGDYSKFGGFYLYDSDGGDSVTVEAASGENTGRLVFDTDKFPSVRPHFTIRTDQSGVIDVNIIKSAGNMYGYGDEFFVREKFSPNAGYGSSACMATTFTVSDESDKLLYGIDKGGLHRVTGTIVNPTETDTDAVVKLVSFRNNGSIFDSDEINLSIGAQENSVFEVAVNAPLELGTQMFFYVKDYMGVRRYRITDNDLERQYSGDNSVFLKTVDIIDTNGDYLNSAVPGQLNILSITAKNNSYEEKPMTGLLCIYNNENRLIEVTTFERNIVANSIDEFAMGTVLPDNEGCYAKLFVWSDFETFAPILDVIRLN